MAVKSYDELVLALKAYSRRDDITDTTWELLIRNAEARIYRKLRIPSMEKFHVRTVPAEAPYIVIPDDFLEMKTIYTVEHPDLIRIAESTRRRKLEINPHASGPITHFSRNGKQFNFWPSPDSEEVTIIYYAEDGGINKDAQFSDMLNLAYDSYLYGTMREVMIFTHFTELENFWNTKFLNSLAEIQTMAEEAEYAGSLKQEEILDSDIGIH